MSDTLTFSGVQLHAFSRDAKSGSASFVANYPTKRICDEMGWGGMTNGAISAKLDGSLHATHVVLEPKEDGLKKHRVKMDVTEIRAFQAFRLELEGHKGKGHRLELRFQMGFVAADACRDLERFLMTCGGAKCSLTVSYVKQADLALEDDRQTSIDSTRAERDEEFE